MKHAFQKKKKKKIMKHAIVVRQLKLRIKKIK